MHQEILNKQQLELLEVMSSFRREYYLVGGTAIALYLGHRRSIDFDMFKLSAITSDISCNEGIRIGTSIEMERLCGFVFSAD